MSLSQALNQFAQNLGRYPITDTDGNLKAQYKMVLSSGYIYRVYQYGFRGFYFA